MDSISSPTAVSGQTKWISKFVASVFAAMAVINIVLMATEVMPKHWQESLSRLFQNNIMAINILPSLLFGLLISIYWQYSERKNPGYSGKIKALLYGIVRYWLAFEISTYGFAKILQTQFAHSFQRDDMLAGSLNGFNLTWHYFSYSYPLSVIIGILQICGSILLLFRRTTLLGVFILLPVLFNILLINIFYRIASGAFLNAVLFTAGLLYLLLLRWSDLRKIFFQTTGALSLPNAGKFTFLLKPIPIIAAFSIIYYFSLKNERTSIAGKWKVDLMIKDKDTVKAGAWINDNNIWSNIYLEDYGRLSICANPYFFDVPKSQFGGYNYNSATKNIRLYIFNTRDSMNLKVVHVDEKKMQWSGIMRNDTTMIFLSKASQERARDNW